jgi:hypothetical protein
MLSWADSPLTSTNFSDAYADEPMVVMAGEHGLGDRIPTELLSFLADKKAPVDVRLAVVNRLTWFSETNDFTQFENYLIKRFKARTGGNYRRNLMPALLPFMPMLWQCPTGPTFRKPAIWFIMR